MSLRRIAETTLGRIQLTRRMPTPYSSAKIVTSGRVGGLKFVFKKASNWDPELIRTAAELVRPGDVVWDVGANVGLFSVAASAIAGNTGRVVAIEADFDAVELLQKTAHNLPVESAPMTVLPVAVSDSSGFVEFAIAKRARAANSIVGYGSTQTGGTSQSRTVPSVTLDNLLSWFLPPKVLKIDVEGAETLVLAGATALLSDVKPRIYCEVSTACSERVTQILRDAGYRLWDGAEFRSSNDEEIERATFNTVALPIA